MTGIYCIENAVNHKKYVGQSKNIKERWNCHRKTLERGTHPNAHLQRAWDKYGKENFSFYVLELCDVESLTEREMYYIKQLNAFEKGYNLTLGGDGTRGFSHSDEYKQKMHDLYVGRTFSDETRRKMSEAKKGVAPIMTEARKKGVKITAEKLKGRIFTEEHRANLSKALKGREPWNKGKKLPSEYSPMFGKHLPEEAKRKISEANRGRKRTEEQRLAHAKKVVCVNTGEIFPSVADAAKSCGASVQALSSMLHGKCATCKKMRWRFVEGSGVS